MNLGLFGQLFLCQLETLTMPADCLSERPADLAFGDLFHKPEVYYRDADDQSRDDKRQSRLGKP
jgi:hypothetical protein